MPASTILVADDDRAIRTVLNQALIRLGHDVRTTGNAATLWRWVADGQGDLVITDVVMPDENGLDLIPRIKKIRPELRVIVMSAQNTLMTAVKAAERGAFEYLPKPFDLKELVNVVERALSARSTTLTSSLRSKGFGRYSNAPRSAALTAVIRVFCALMTMTRSSGRIFLIRGMRSSPFSSGMTTSVITRSPCPSATQRHRVAAFPVVRTS